MPLTLIPANYSFSLGTLIAFCVLILCLLLYFLDHALTGKDVLLFLGALALARLT